MLTLESIKRWVQENFFHRRQYVRSSAGAADAGRPVVLDAQGRLAASLLDVQVKNSVALGYTETVESGYQLIVWNSYTVIGTLVVAGDMVIL